MSNFGDSFIKEYLVSKCYLDSLKCFSSEIKHDRDTSFRADKFCEAILNSNNTYNLAHIIDLFNYMNCNLFSKLEQNHLTILKKIQYGVYKFFLVTAYQNGRSDKIQEFFSQLSSEISNVMEWKDWFALPFVKSQDEIPGLSIYFTKQWQDNLMMSFNNFLATAFLLLSPPIVTKMESETNLVNYIQDENALLRAKLENINIQRDGAGQCCCKQGVSTVKPIEISPPSHIIDDFFIIAQETLNVVNTIDPQVKGLKSIIRHISTSGSSPVMGKKDGSVPKQKKKIFHV